MTFKIWGYSIWRNPVIYLGRGKQKNNKVVKRWLRGRDQESAFEPFS